MCVQDEGNSLLYISQPVLHSLSLYCAPLAHIAHPQPVYCTPSSCILHTISLYCRYVLDTGWACRTNILYLMCLVATLMLLENQCIKTVSKNAYVFEIHRRLLAFPEISIVKPCAPLKALVPLSCFKQILQQASKILHQKR